MAARTALGSDPFARKKKSAAVRTLPPEPAPEATAEPAKPRRKATSRKKAAPETPPPSDVVEVAGEIAERVEEPLPPLPPQGDEALLESVTTPPPSSLPHLTGVRGIWSNLRMRGVADEVDGFGFDPIYFQQVEPVLDFLYARYWRIAIHGAENIPANGRAILVANHSGGFPYDGVMLMYGLHRALGITRTPRPLVEDDFWHLPFLGVRLSRLGAVRANPENAERLLRSEQLVAVFPEGIKGLGKNYRERYKLQRFGRGGYVKLALRTRSPIVPVAIVGAEEVHPMVAKLTWPVTRMGLPYLPITPTFPWLGALGLLPLPSRWSIRVGAPIDLGARDDVDLDDMVTINQLSERVRAEIQRMIDDGLAARQSVIFG